MNKYSVFNYELTHLRHWVQQRSLQSRNDTRQVGGQILQRMTHITPLTKCLKTYSEYKGLKDKLRCHLCFIVHCNISAQLAYLLVSEGVHVANDLSGHLACVGGAILEGSLDDGHDEGEWGSVDEVDELGVQQCLQARLCLLGWIREGVQQDGGYGWEKNDIAVKTLAD